MSCRKAWITVYTANTMSRILSASVLLRGDWKKGEFPWLILFKRVASLFLITSFLIIHHSGNKTCSVCMCPGNHKLTSITFQIQRLLLSIWYKQICLSQFCACCTEVYIKGKKVWLNVVFILVICNILIGREVIK